ncbi:MAG: hypothetical protein M3Y44_16180 [Actinomycetota bacterium]|nr:hypothetical protein [Actinomycetota bacterium]
MPSTPNPAARTVVVATLTAALALAGCATVVTGSGGKGGPPNGASSSGDFPSGASSSATPSTSSALPSTSSTTPSPSGAAGGDITDIKYSVPTGWERSTNYVEVIPLEASYQVKYLIPSGATQGLDVISIVLYRLPGPHLADTHAQQLARIHTYERRRNLTIVRALRDTEVGGLLAFDESVVQPGGSQGEFRYATWYVFGGAHVVQISCQVESQADTVASGCQKLLDSMTFR